MNEELRKKIYNNLKIKDTDELLDIWQNGSTEEWIAEVFEIVRIILQERIDYLPPRSNRSQLEEIYQKVNQLIDEGNFTKALVESEKLIQTQPSQADEFYQRGTVYEELEEYSKAISDYQAALRLDPEYEEALTSIQIIEIVLAKEFCESGTKEYLDQALEFAYDDESNQALEAIELAKPILPNIAPAYNYLGLIYETLEQLEPAIESYTTATYMNPRFLPAWKNLGNARVRLEEEQYHLSSRESTPENLDLEEATLYGEDLDDINMDEFVEPVPGWVYLNEKSFLLSGWAGHRTRPGRSGYDPLETDFEQAFITGVIIHRLITRKFRTHNILYLMGMTIIGIVYSLPFLLIVPVFFGNWGFLILWAFYSLYWIIGIALLVNVYLSLQVDDDNENEVNGSSFY